MPKPYQQYEGPTTPAFTPCHVAALRSSVGGYLFTELKAGSCSSRVKFAILEDLLRAGAIANVRTRTLRRAPGQRYVITAQVTPIGSILRDGFYPGVDLHG